MQLGESSSEVLSSKLQVGKIQLARSNGKQPERVKVSLVDSWLAPAHQVRTRYRFAAVIFVVIGRTLCWTGSASQVLSDRLHLWVAFLWPLSITALTCKQSLPRPLTTLDHRPLLDPPLRSRLLLLSCVLLSLSSSISPSPDLP